MPLCTGDRPAFFSRVADLAHLPGRSTISPLRAQTLSGSLFGEDLEPPPSAAKESEGAKESPHKRPEVPVTLTSLMSEKRHRRAAAVAVLTLTLAVVSAVGPSPSPRDQVALTEPPTLRPGPGGAAATLRVEDTEHVIDGVLVRHRSYNGGLVGPVLRVKPGDVLRIRLENRLPPEPFRRGNAAGNIPHGFNTTSLHAHGLRLPPEADGAQASEVGPSGSHVYSWEVPGDHPPGTFWYHPDAPGSIALQTTSGMAGAVVVEGGVDRQWEVAAARDEVFVLQQFIYGVHREGEREVGEMLPGIIYKGNFAVPPAVTRTDKRTLINGRLRPSIVMAPGEIRRWRLVHAGNASTLILRLEGHTFYEIAVDGMCLGRRVERETIILQPGSRADVLVQAAQTPGTYRFVDAPILSAESLHRREEAELELAEVIVRGEPVSMTLPDDNALKPFTALSPIAEAPSVLRTVEFDSNPTGSVPMINRRAYDRTAVDPEVALGSVEDWTLTSRAGTHLFHIHSGPFEVVAVEDQASGAALPSERVWRDTLLVRPGRRYTIRLRFDGRPGQSVYHCQFADHGDRGERQAFQVNDLDAAPLGGAATELPTVRQSLADPPRPAPDWSLPDADGRLVRRADLARPGHGLVLVFHRGVGCLHCAEQLGQIARLQPHLEATGFALAAVSAATIRPRQAELSRSRLGIRYPLLSDSSHDVFRLHGCYRIHPLHATVVIDSLGRIRWMTTGESPDFDVERLLSVCRRVAHSYDE